MTTSETQIQNAHAETAILDLELGSEVEVVFGPLCGLRGTVVNFRGSGRALISVQMGTYLDIPPYQVRACGGDR